MKPATTTPMIRLPASISQRTRVLTGYGLAVLPLALLVFAMLWLQLQSDERRIAAERTKLAEVAAVLVGSFIEGHVRTARALSVQRQFVQPKIDAEYPAFLRSIVAQNPDWEGLGLIGPDGYSLAASQGPLPKIYLGDRPYFRKAVSSGQAAVSSALIGRVSQLPTIIVAVPVDFAAGGRGALIVPLPTERLGQLLMRRIGSPSAQVVVVDEEEHIFIHPDPAVVRSLKPLRGNAQSAAALKGQSGHALAEFLGVRSLVAYAPIPAYGWGALIAEPADAAFALAYKSMLEGALLFAVILAVVGLLAWSGAGRIVTSERALFESRERLRVTLASIGDAVITTDLDGRVAYLNPVAETLTGWKAEQAAGQPLERVFSIVEAGTRQPLASPVARALREGVVIGLANHTVLLGKDGSQRPIDDSAAPIRNEKGAVIGCVLIFRDVSDRTEKEQRIETLLEELSVANRRKDAFLATLSHELRAPLAPLKSWLEIMRRAGGDASLAEQARHSMARQVGQMERLIADLLEMSRISSDKLELRIEQVELVPVLEHAIEASQPLLRAAGHKFEFSAPREPLYLSADPLRIGQVFGNILNNACKYTPPGGRILLSVHTEGNEAVIRVRDNGIGIARDMLSRIFEMFVQVDQSLERTQGGLGIGLTLVKRLVEMHGGTVQAFSEGLGFGTEIIVRLPLLKTDIRKDPREAQPVRPAPGKLRILIADDNPDAAGALALLLGLSGHEVHVAHDGMEALRMAAALRPGVALLDLGMPKLNGYDACQAMRKEPWGKTMLLVALTGWGQEEARRRTAAAGFDAHLVKPADPSAIEALLAGRSEAGVHS